MKILAKLVLPFFLSTVSIAEETPQFDCSLLVAEGQNAFRRITLNQQAYSCFKQTGHRDLMVINGLNQAVPFRVRRQSSENSLSTSQKTLTIFQEPVAASYKTSDQIRRFRLLTGVDPGSDGYSDWQAANAFYASIILLNENPNGVLKTLQLGLKNLAANPVKATVLLESSDDLQRWSLSSDPQTLFYLSDSNDSLNKNNLKAGNHHNKKYIRLAILSNQQDFTQLIDEVSASFEERSTVEPQIQWQKATEVSALDTSQNWQYSIPHLLPVSQIRLKANNDIVFYSGNIYFQRHLNPSPESQTDGLRDRQKAKVKSVLKQALKGEGRQAKNPPINWIWQRNFRQFEFKSPQTTSATAIDFRAQQSKQWRLSFEQPAELLAEQLPDLEFGWTPSQIEFIAQGPEPFKLLVGSDEAIRPINANRYIQNQNASIEDVALLGIEKIKAAEVSTEIEAEANMGINLSKILLWAVLLAGVALMVFMALQLSRKMSAEKP